MTPRAIYHYEQLLLLTPEHYEAGSAKKHLKALTKSPNAR
jgi:hypothetical protein